MTLSLATVQPASLARAAQKADTLNPFTRLIVLGDYQVIGSRSNVYNVTIEQGRAVCDCDAGRSNYMCYHVAAALKLHVLATHAAPMDMRLQLTSAPLFDCVECGALIASGQVCADCAAKDFCRERACSSREVALGVGRCVRHEADYEDTCFV